MSFGDQLRKAAEGGDDFDPANGAYTVRITDGGAFAGKDGREWAKVVLEIIGTDANGRQFDDFMNMNNDVGRAIAVEKLVTYGVDLTSIEELEDLDHAIFNLIGTIAEVTVTHKNGYRNVSVRSSRTNDSDIPTSPEREPAPAGQQSFAAAAADDGDIPF